MNVEIIRLLIKSFTVVCDVTSGAAQQQLLAQEQAGGDGNRDTADVSKEKVRYGMLSRCHGNHLGGLGLRCLFHHDKAYGGFQRSEGFNSRTREPNLFL